MIETFDSIKQFELSLLDARLTDIDEIVIAQMNIIFCFASTISTRMFSILLLLVLSACATSNNQTTNASVPSFSLSGFKSSWIGANSKYSELAKGPLSSEIGTSLSKAAMKQAIQAEYNALETGKSGEITRWQYSSTQNGKITSYPPYQVGSSNCRRYIHSVSVEGATRQAVGTACRDKDGTWTPLS